MRNRLWVVVLALLSVIGAAVVGTMAGNNVLTPAQIGEIIGVASAGFAITGLIPMLFWAARRFRSEAAGFPFILWSVLLPVFFFFVANGNKISAELGQDVFSPDGCTFSVVFPTRAERRVVSTADGPQILQARLDGPDYHLRAECLTVGRTLSDEEVFDSFRYRVLADGLQGVEFATYKQAGHRFLVMRAHKIIEQQSVTYKVLATQGEGAILFLAVGGVSENFPQAQITEFFESVQRRGRVNGSQGVQ